MIKIGSCIPADHAMQNIGKYMVGRTPYQAIRYKIWIENELGEGGEFDMPEKPWTEEKIDKLFTENF